MFGWTMNTPLPVYLRISSLHIVPRYIFFSSELSNLLQHSHSCSHKKINFSSQFSSSFSFSFNFFYKKLIFCRTFPPIKNRKSLWECLRVKCKLSSNVMISAVVTALKRFFCSRILFSNHLNTSIVLYNTVPYPPSIDLVRIN